MSGASGQAVKVFSSGARLCQGATSANEVWRAVRVATVVAFFFF